MSQNVTMNFSMGFHIVSPTQAFTERKKEELKWLHSGAITCPQDGSLLGTVLVPLC